MLTIITGLILSTGEWHSRPNVLASVKDKKTFAWLGRTISIALHFIVSVPSSSISSIIMPRGRIVNMDSHTVHEILPQPKKRGRTKVKMVATSTQPPPKAPTPTTSQKRSRTGSFDHEIPLARCMPDLEPLDSSPSDPPSWDTMEDSAHEVNPNIYVRHSGKTSQGTVCLFFFEHYTLISY